MLEFVVDKFHFRGHKDDPICHAFCNPHSKKELHTQDGKPLFNTSMCESSNRWLKTLSTSLRHASPVWADFVLYTFVDERNKYTYGELKKGE